MGVTNPESGRIEKLSIKPGQGYIHKLMKVKLQRLFNRVWQVCVALLSKRYKRISQLVAILGILAVITATVRATAPQPDGGGVRTGTLPRTWLLGGPDCRAIPEFEAYQYNEDLYILRQSGCSHYEKPFLYLFFGTEKALLLDTGAGEPDTARAVQTVVNGWLARNGRRSIPLEVIHSHAHSDHIAGDGQFQNLPGTTLVLPNLPGVQSFFGIAHWPEQIVQHDLGKRVLDIIPIPGHEATSIALYDRQTGILFTGDTLYPGRLYVEDGKEFTQGIRRLVEFTQGKVVAHILGCHIENTRTPYLDYPVGTVYQPDEHALELGRAHLIELDQALQKMDGNIVRTALRDFTIWPVAGPLAAEHPRHRGRTQRPIIHTLDTEQKSESLSYEAS